MTIDLRTSNGVTIVDLQGKVTIEVTAQLRRTIADLLEADRNNILLNLGEVSFMDSSGIGELVRSYHSVKRAGGNVKLLHLTKRIQELLAITKLVTIFESFDEESEALASFSP